MTNVNPNPLVSVLLPTYNRSQYLEQSITSILEQDYKNIEIIIIDDGSKDETELVVSKIKSSKIRYFKNNKNLGLQKTLNRGLQLATGTLIARLDDQDTWIDKSKVTKQVDIFRKNPETVLVGVGVEVVNLEGKLVKKFLLPETDREIRNVILSKNVFVHSGVMFSRDKALAAGGYDECPDLKHIEDFALWLKLGKLGKLYNLPIYGVRYVDDSSSITNQNIILQVKRSKTLIKRYRGLYPNYFRALLRQNTRALLYGYLNFLTEKPRQLTVLKYSNILK